MATLAADGAVLVALPGVRRPGAPAAAPPAGSAHAALAAASEGRRPAGRGRQVPDVPDPARGVPGVPAGRLRRAGAARGARAAAQPGSARRHRRHRQAEPDGPEPAVQLDRRLHVRGRRAAGRAPGRRAGPRPRPAARPARRRGAARAARPRRAGRRRARPAAAVRRPPGPQRRRAARRAAPRRRPDRARSSICAASSQPDEWLAELLAEKRAIEIVVAGETRYAAADDAARYRDGLGCALPLGLPGTFTEPVARPLEDLIARYGADARTVHRARGGQPLRRPRGAGRSVRSARWRPTAASSAASSARTACAASGATPTCSASCAGGRWRRCVARSSPSSPRRWPGSCRHGTASRLSAAASTRSSRRSACWPARRSSRRRWSPTSWPARVRDYRPAQLDELCTSGDVVWVGAGAIGSADGRVRLGFADQLPLLAPGWEALEPPDGQAARRAPRRAGGTRRQLLEPAAGRGARRRRGRAAGGVVGPRVGR